MSHGTQPVFLFFSMAFHQLVWFKVHQQHATTCQNSGLFAMTKTLYIVYKIGFII
jgi:hypothetical protein